MGLGRSNFRDRSSLLRIPPFQAIAFNLNGGNKAIAQPWNGFKENGILRRFSQRLTSSLYGRVYAFVVVDKGSFGPQLLPQFFACDHFSWSLQEHLQDQESLVRHMHQVPVFVESARGQVDLETAEG